MLLPRPRLHRAAGRGARAGGGGGAGGVGACGGRGEGGGCARDTLPRLFLLLLELLAGRLDPPPPPCTSARAAERARARGARAARNSRTARISRLHNSIRTRGSLMPHNHTQTTDSVAFHRRFTRLCSGAAPSPSVFPVGGPPRPRFSRLAPRRGNTRKVASNCPSFRENRLGIPGARERPSAPSARWIGSI